MEIKNNKGLLFYGFITFTTLIVFLDIFLVKSNRPLWSLLIIAMILCIVSSTCFTLAFMSCPICRRKTRFSIKNAFLDFFCGEKERKKCMGGLTSKDLLEIAQSDPLPSESSPFARIMGKILHCCENEKKENIPDSE